MVGGPIILNGMIKLSFLGDLMCLKAQNEAALKKYGRLEYKPQFAACKRLLEESDYVLGNLETTITPSRSKSNHDLVFNSPLEYLEAIKDLGVGFVSLANNHILDQGVEGLKESIECIERMGIDYSGAYKNEEDGERVFIKDIGGIRFSVLCHTFGTNSQINGNFLIGGQIHLVDLLNKQKKPLRYWNPDSNVCCKEYIADEISIAAVRNSENAVFQQRLKDKIIKAKQQSDFVISMPHMGGQYNPHPGQYAKWMMNFIKDCGADMIVAGHPHVPQKSFWDGSVFGCFSLGNFACTPYVGWSLPNSFTEYGIVLHAYFDEISKNLTKVSFSIVKSIVDEDGYTTIIPVKDLVGRLTSVENEKLQIDCEEIISRVRGFNDNINCICDEIIIEM